MDTHERAEALQPGEYVGHLEVVPDLGVTFCVSQTRIQVGVPPFQ